MKTIPQNLFIVLLFIIEILVSGEQILQTHDIKQKVSAENAELETIKNVTTEGSLLTKTENHELRENSSNLLELKNNRTSPNEAVNQASNSMESELVQIVLKDESHLTDNHSELEGNAKNFTKYLVKVNTNPLINLEASQSSDMIKSELVQIILKDVINNHRETKDTEEVFTETSLATSTAEDHITNKFSNSLMEFQHSNLDDSELIEIVFKDVTNQTTKQKEIKYTAEVPTESLAEKVNTTKKSLISSEESESLNSTESGLIQIVLKDLTDLASQQAKINDNGRVSTESSVKVDGTSTAGHQLTTKFSVSSEGSQSSNLTKNGLIQIVLKDLSDLTNKEDKINDNGKVSTESSVKVDATSTAGKQLNNKFSAGSEASQSSNLSENGLMQIVLKEFTDFTNKEEKINDNGKFSTESSVKVEATSTAGDELTTKFSVSDSLEGSRSSNLSANGLMQKVSENVTNLMNKQKDIKDTEEGFTESLVKADFTIFIEDQLTIKPLHSPKASQNLNFPERESVKLVLKDVTNSPNNQNKIKMAEEVPTVSLASTSAEDQLSKKLLSSKEMFENSILAESELNSQIVSKDVTESLENTNPTSTSEDQVPTKPFISLEDYAVKQMNFILDHLLMETQEFVAKLLQASINSVFQKDHLKRYAEDINRILNPDDDSDYSDENIKDKKIYTQDEIYEKIIQKLNFLKSKATKSLQKNLPQEWTNDYRHKRAELAIWLDKAVEEMHTEFNCYLTEEEDHIKYQYFNDTFEDISRATEIHHKLALLADLVKIVKNKKQITFMDLYMQT